MNRRETLELLQDVFGDAVFMQTADDDPSGYRTRYLVDHEQIMKNIDVALKNEEQHAK